MLVVQGRFDDRSSRDTRQFMIRFLKFHTLDERRLCTFGNNRLSFGRTWRDTVASFKCKLHQVSPRIPVNKV